MVEEKQDFRLNEVYLDEEKKRAKKSVFNKKKHNKFGSNNNFSEWWVKQIILQNGECYYCKTPIRLIEKLIQENLLGARKSRNGGIRGKYLELERVNHINNIYEPTNCVLICCYCNNDKSNIFNSDIFIKFLAPAKNAVFKYLQKQLLKPNGDHNEL